MYGMRIGIEFDSAAEPYLVETIYDSPEAFWIINWTDWDEGVESSQKEGPQSVRNIS